MTTTAEAAAGPRAPAADPGPVRTEGGPDPSTATLAPDHRPGNRRRRVLVLPALQLRLVLHSVLMAGLFLLAVFLVLFAPLILSLRRAGNRAEEAWEAAAPLLYLHHTFWFAGGGALILVAALTLLVSHRIAGPLYRFRRIYTAIREGRVPAPFRLRRQDLLAPDAEGLNGALAALQGLGRELDAARGRLDAACRGLAGLRSDPAFAGVLAELERCRAELTAAAGRLRPEAGEGQP